MKYTCPKCGSAHSRKSKWKWIRICLNCGHTADAYWFKHPEQAASAYSTVLSTSKEPHT